MFETEFKFFKVTNSNLRFIFLKKKMRLLVMSMLTILSFMIYVYGVEKSPMYVLVSIALYMIAHYILNDIGKRVLKEECRIRSKKALWDSKKFNEWRDNYICGYFKKKYNKEQLIEFKKIASRRATDTRFDFLKYISALSVIFVPIWANYLSRIFSLCETASEATDVFVKILAAVFFLMALVGVFTYLIKTSFESLISESYHYRQFVLALDNIIISYRDVDEKYIEIIS